MINTVKKHLLRLSAALLLIFMLSGCNESSSLSDAHPSILQGSWLTSGTYSLRQVVVNFHEDGVFEMCQHVDSDTTYLLLYGTWALSDETDGSKLYLLDTDKGKIYFEFTDESVFLPVCYPDGPDDSVAVLKFVKFSDAVQKWDPEPVAP